MCAYMLSHACNSMSTAHADMLSMYGDSLINTSHSGPIRLNTNQNTT